MPEGTDVDPRTYLGRTLRAIADQCERRGIVEVDGFRAYVAEEYGKPVAEMDDRELRRLNQDLAASCVAYLDGQKRRGEPGFGLTDAGGEAFEASG